MTDRRPAWIFLLLGLAGALPAAEAPPLERGDDERISPSGPYRSRVRVLEPGATEAPADPATMLEQTDDDYARALLLRQLAHRGLAGGDDTAAIRRFEEALALEALAPHAAAQMQLNLGQLYARAGRFAEAAAALEAGLAATPAPEPVLLLTLAAAYAQTGRFDEAAASAARAVAAEPTPPPDWFHLLLYAHYRLGDLDSCIVVLRDMLGRWPEDTELWLQLASLQHASGDTAGALAALELAALRGLLTEPDQWLRLAHLRLAGGVPDRAAQLVAELLEQGRLEPVADNWRLLASAWLQARELHRALPALERAAELDGDAATWLRAGELATELEDWAGAARLLDRALAARPADGSYGRTLLLLGQARYRLGQRGAAERAFREAAELGGVYLAAQQWLDFLAVAAEAPPAGAAESVAPQSVAPQSVALVGQTQAVAPTQAEPDAAPAAPLEVKQVPAMRLYAAGEQTRGAELVAVTRELARELGRVSRRERLEWMGPMHIIFHGPGLDADDPVRVEAGAPLRRVAPNRGRFSSRALAPFECVYRRYEGSWEGLAGAWRELWRDAEAAGYRASGEARQVMVHVTPDADAGIVVELQIGIM